jgi:3-methyladenine DNA glycosylase AlkD
LSLKVVRRELNRLKNEETRKISQRFFKTGPGEYAEGDKFLGVRVPQLRKLAKTYRHLTTRDIKQLLKSPIHEERLLALFILIHQYRMQDEGNQKTIFDLYMQNTRHINNWDLVDGSAEHIVGAFLRSRNRNLLHRLAKSKSLWERRIAIMSTFHFIKQNEFSETLKISKILLSDEEDLIHKAVGWMLREVGKRKMAAEEAFLKKHYKKMPRTMLRYAIERFPESKRQRYLRGSI